jgi:hypothetical protein
MRVAMPHIWADSGHLCVRELHAHQELHAEQRMMAAGMPRKD